MKAPEVISVRYSIGGEIIRITSTDPDVAKIADSAPGVAVITYTDNITEVIVSNQMVVRYRVDMSKIEVIDMDIARVS